MSFSLDAGGSVAILCSSLLHQPSPPPDGTAPHVTASLTPPRLPGPFRRAPGRFSVSHAPASFSAILADQTYFCRVLGGCVVLLAVGGKYRCMQQTPGFVSPSRLEASAFPSSGSRRGGVYPGLASPRPARRTLRTLQPTVFPACPFALHSTGAQTFGSASYDWLCCQPRCLYIRFVCFLRQSYAGSIQDTTLHCKAYENTTDVGLCECLCARPRHAHSL